MRADGLAIDFIEGPDGAGFKLSSPLEPPKVKALGVKELKQWMESEASLRALRCAHRARAGHRRMMEGSTLLDKEGEEKLLALPKETTIVFQCHHGCAVDRPRSTFFRRVSATSITSRAASRRGRARSIRRCPDIDFRGRHEGRRGSHFEFDLALVF